MIRNMTNETIIFLDKDNNVIRRIEPCGETIEISKFSVIEDHIIGRGYKEGIPTKSIRETYKFVQMDPGIIYVVSMHVLRAFPGREDFYAPMDKVKDSNGKVIGYRSLGRFIF